jgi:hypothetical protein
MRGKHVVARICAGLGNDGRQGSIEVEAQQRVRPGVALK